MTSFYAEPCCCLVSAHTVCPATMQLCHHCSVLLTTIVRNEYCIVSFKCSLDYAKHSFYCAANGIFGKIGRIASEDVVIQLLKSKCIPVLLYSVEVCNLSTRDVQYSLDFTVNRFFMKLFCTKDMSVVKYCQQMFHVELPSDIIKKNKKALLSQRRPRDAPNIWVP